MTRKKKATRSTWFLLDDDVQPCERCGTIFPVEDEGTLCPRCFDLLMIDLGLLR
jgi:hypothetical protein